jgi:hypothetical protein
MNGWQLWLTTQAAKGPSSDSSRNRTPVYFRAVRRKKTLVVFLRIPGLIVSIE